MRPKNVQCTHITPIKPSLAIIIYVIIILGTMMLKSIVTASRLSKSMPLHINQRPWGIRSAFLHSSSYEKRCISNDGSRFGDRLKYAHGYGCRAQVKTKRFMESYSQSSSKFKIGDVVRFNNDGTIVTGTVMEHRGGGWYSIIINNADDNEMNGMVVKRRRNELSLVATNGTEAGDASTVEATSSPSFTTSKPPPVVPPPTIMDLDMAMNEVENGNCGDMVLSRDDRQFLSQCVHHASYSKWILFTDLHCSPNTLQTTLQVLSTVHQTAKQRNAGVLFLGDWWHHRGYIRIDCLNAILDALSTWDVPLVMIPGNHDQVTLGGLDHGLTALQNAFRVQNPNPNDKNDDDPQSHPGPLIFSLPTKFAGALFVPHIRDVALLESVLRSDAARTATALFVHADVTGAMMNDLIVSQNGVPPSSFPPDKPIYSGHFHKPHVVRAPLSAPGVSVRYAGSPYETSLSEAGQRKALLVLDSSMGWICEERIPLNVGRMHFRCNSMEEFLQLPSVVVVPEVDDDGGRRVPPSRGDRVVVSVSKRELEDMSESTEPGRDSIFDAKVKQLRTLGVQVEIREIKTPSTNGSASVQQTSDGFGMMEVEDKSPPAIFASFLESEVTREAMSVDTANRLKEAGTSLLEKVLLPETKLEEGATAAAAASSAERLTMVNTTDLILESVSVKGFGSFRDSVTYPLYKRGVVLLRGTNEDIGFDSNGSGKSTLAMSVLWGLTGYTDPRPVQDAKVADVIHDECKSATVSVHGFVNSVPFTVKRVKTASKSSLIFLLGDQDMTRQSVKETQQAISEVLGVGPGILSRTIFHGQHSMNGLLEATDTKLKEELSNIVSLSVWQEATSLARLKSRTYSKKVSEMDGMISIRKEDEEVLSKRCSDAEEIAISKLKALEADAHAFEKEMEQLMNSSLDDDLITDEKFDECQSLFDESAKQLEDLESEKQNMIAEKDSQLSTLNAEIEKHLSWMNLAKNDIQSTERIFDRAENALASANSHLDHVISKWKSSGIDVLSGIFPENGRIQACPTCKQPIRNGHSHAPLIKTMEDEVLTAKKAVQTAQSSFSSAEEALEDDRKGYTILEDRTGHIQYMLEKTEREWRDRLESLDNLIREARNLQMQRAQDMTQMAMRVQRSSELRSKKASAEFELRRMRGEYDSSLTTHENLLSEVKDIQNHIHQLQIERDTSKNLSKIMSNLSDSFGPRGVQTFVLQNAVHALQTTSQKYLDHLSDGSQRLELTLDAGDRITRTAAIRRTDGNWVRRPLSSLSGGQWRRCSLALGLGFSELVARRGCLRPSLLVLDEPLTHLDAVGRANFGKLLRVMLQQNLLEKGGSDYGSGLNLSTILVILQDLAAEEMEENFDRTDEVIKKDGGSVVRLDGMG